MSAFDPRTSSNSVVTRTGSRHQLKRSLTEFASPGRLGRQSRKDRAAAAAAAADDRAPPLSSVTNLQYQGRFSLDLPRSEGVTPVMSPDPSRRPSVMLPREEEKLAGVLAEADLRAEREEKLREERDKAAARVEGLKDSLDQLSAFSTSTSRRLDETYYSVLEKVSTLQGTMAALKELAEETRSIHKSFEKDSREIENDIALQLAPLGQFKEQQSSIEALRKRIHNGRDRIRALSDRVDVVRERIECWEKADHEFQERTRRRLRAMWVVFSIIALTMTLLYLGAHYVPPGLEIMHVETAKVSPAAEAVAEVRNETVQMPIVDDVPVLEDGGRYTKRSAIDDDEALRAFDEL